MDNPMVNYSKIIAETASNHYNVRDEYKDNSYEQNVAITRNEQRPFSVGAINITGELNIGMMIRSACLLGAENFYIFGRKKFDKRSTVGAEKYINIAEGCAPSGINNAIRELMAQVKDMQSGTDADNFAVGGNLTVTGTATGVTATFGDSTTKFATTAFVQAALAAAYPVGSIYINATNNTNPGTLLGFGTWAAFGAGRVMVGFNGSDPLFDAAEETGGSKDATLVSHTHTATVSDPGHAHSTALYYRPHSASGAAQQYAQNTTGFGSQISTNSNTTGITVSNSTEGSSGTNANLQPYITVYMWKRTA